MGVRYPVPKHFRFIAGNTFAYAFKYVKDDAPVDLTDYTATWTITYDDNGTPIDVVYDTNAAPGESGVFFGGNTQDPTNGFITLVLTAEDTAAQPWRYAIYKLEPTIGGDTFTLLQGGMGHILSSPPANMNK